MKARLKRGAKACWRVFDPVLVCYCVVMPWVRYALALQGGQWWVARAYAIYGALMFAWYRWQNHREGELRYAEGELAQLTRIIESGAYPPQQVKKQYWRW